MNNPNLDEATREELVAHIKQQEAVIGGVSNLIAELKVSCNILSEDVKRANEGKEDGFILLNDSKNFQRILTMVKNLEYFEALENGCEPKETSKSAKMKLVEKDIEPVRKKLNIQDYTIKS